MKSNLMAQIKKSSFDDKLASLLFLLITISISFFMYSGEITRNFFYIATYIAVLYFIYVTLRVDKKIKFYPVACTILLLGISKLLWVMLTVNHQYPLIAYHYQNSGKRLILASFILYAIYLKTGERMKINSDAPPSGAYTFTIFSLLVMYSLKYHALKHYRLICLIVMTLTFAVLAATETRSAIILFILISAGSIIYDFTKSSHTSKIIYGFAIAVLIIAAVTSGHPYYNKVLTRFDNLQNEVTSYNDGERNTSVGARFSMWRAGVDAFKHHPFGQSADSRNALATTFIDEHEGGNPEALRNLQFHLHNDIIDTMSLQGILGALIMVLFFAVLLLYPFRLVPKGYEFLLLSVPVIYFSMGDTQFYNRESPYFIVLVFAFLMMLRMRPHPAIEKQ